MEKVLYALYHGNGKKNKGKKNAGKKCKALNRLKRKAIKIKGNQKFTESLYFYCIQFILIPMQEEEKH